MSTLATNAITDASGGNTTTINGYTPTMSNMAGRNRIINGDMRIDQRNAGASVTLSSSVVFPVDRFGSQTNVGSGHTLEQVEDAPAGFIQSLKLTVGTGATPTGTNYGRLRQLVEANNTADLNFGTSNAKTITVSFWVKSSVTGTFGLSVFNNANDRSYVSTYTVSSANTWEQKTITVVGDTSGTWTTDNSAGVSIAWDLGEGPDRSKAAGSWGATVGSGYGLTGGTKILATSGATFYITGVQLEAGSVATPFEHRQYGQELALCQRYYQAYYGNTTATLGGMGARINAPGTGNGIQANIPLKVTMRASATGTRVGTWSVLNCGQPSMYSDGNLLSVYSSSSSAGDVYFYALSTVGVTLNAEL
jgi:hypothetical protein